MSLYDWWAKTSKAEISRLARNKLRCKTYAPDWRNPRVRYRVIDRKRVGNFVILLVKYGHDHAVFTDLLAPKSVPSDKFTGPSLKDGRSLFRAIVRSEEAEAFLWKRERGTVAASIPTDDSP